MVNRFSHLNFNLMRAIEFFQDMNHAEMDVSAPPSSLNYTKEYQVASRLNECLQNMIQEGFFEDCTLRGHHVSDEEYDDEEGDEDDVDDEEASDEGAPDEEEEERRSGYSNGGPAYSQDDELETPRSEGFDYSHSSASSDGRASQNSLSDRFRKYVRRILPKRGRSTSRSKSRSKSRTRSKSRSR